MGIMAGGWCVHTHRLILMTGFARALKNDNPRLAFKRVEINERKIYAVP